MIYDIVLSYVAFSLACGGALIMLAIRDRRHFEATEADPTIESVISADEGQSEADIPLMLMPQREEGHAEPLRISVAPRPRIRSGGVSR